MKRFDIHGIGLELDCPEPALEAAISHRLTDFAATDLPQPTIRFVFEAADKEHTVSRPEGAGRTVYDPPSGEVTYFPELDTLYIAPDELVRVRCDGPASAVTVSFREAALADLWLLSRPLFTLPLMELLKQHGLYSVHAAAVVVDGRAVLFAGGTGAGKSTLAVAHAERGFALLGDDLVFLRSEKEGALEALAFRDEVDLTQETASWFPALSDFADQPVPAGWRKHRVRPEALHGTYIAGAAPAALIFPGHGASVSALEPLSSGDALTELAPNVLLTDPAASQRHLDALRALVDQAGCYRLSAGRDFEQITTLVRGLL